VTPIQLRTDTESNAVPQRKPWYVFVSLFFLAIVLLAQPHIKAASAEVGSLQDAPVTCLVGLPTSSVPEGGWPVFVLLHGYGTNKEDFDALVDEINRHDFVAVSVDAPQVLGPGRRQWGRSIEETHEYLQEQISFLSKDDRFDTRRIHLGGFSQGGIRSLLLVAHYPEAYGGSFSLSPAGGALPDAPKRGTGSHPLFLVYGTAENSGILNSATVAKEFWAEWKQPLQTRTHPGGHHFPSDWATVTEEAVEWIVRSSKTTE